MKAHVVNDDDFAEFAAGYGTGDGIATLRAAQASRRLLMLRVITDNAPSPWTEAAYALLSEVREQAPAVFAATISSPTFGTWTALALRALRGADPTSGATADRLGEFAAAAAIRAGLEFSLDLPSYDSAVFLPGLGLAAAGDTWVTAQGKAGRYRIGDVDLPVEPCQDGHGWLALRRLTSTVDGLRLDVLLDDLDPRRGNHGLSPASRCTDVTVDRWRDLTGRAWEILVQHHPRYAQAIAAGLHTVVPLNAPISGNSINATSMWAFGSVSLTLPATELGLASSLLHEFQHAKLGALLVLFQMYEDAGARRFYAPWRDDPRPLGGLLQGVYAFLGVTDFWRVQRRVLPGTASEFATFEFVRWRQHVRRALTTLQACDEFNSIGREFLAGMRATLAGWLDEPVPGPVTALAAEAGDDHWTGWRLRNIQLDPADGHALVTAWLNGQPPPWPVRGHLAPGEVHARARNSRLDLAVLRVNDPDEFAGTCAGPAGEGRFTAADTAYARGDYGYAATAYLGQITADPDDLQSWAGLAMACRHRGPARDLWRANPELPFAVHRATRAVGAPPPDPIRVAEWLATARRTHQIGGGSTTQ